MSRKVLVVAAHPDDETLGCGGTMARHADEGDHVEILILGEGATSRAAVRDADRDASTLEGLRVAGQKAAGIVGAKGIEFGGLPDNRFDSMDLLDIVKVVETAKARVAPDIVYTHHGGDLNVDHRLTQQAVLTAFRAQPGETAAGLYAFEVQSSTEWSGPEAAASFQPDHHVEITSYLATKIAALECYHAEMRAFPHSRSFAAIEHLARLAGSHVGVPAAERFRTLRSIRREGRPA